MTCPNYKTKVIKMSDTKFWCCDEQKEISEIMPSPNKYCEFCGQRLSINGL